MSVETASSSRAQTVSETLSSAIELLENDQNLKKQIRESMEPIDDLSRSATTELNKLHSAPFSQHAEICQNAINIISRTQPLWVDVAKLIPENEFYRYQFALGPTMRNLTTSIVLARFILHDELTPSHTISTLLGIQTDSTSVLQLSAEDYLQGVIGAVNELPRLSVNAVTSQNFELPIKISSFVNDIFASYSLLNLRNDALRRKFDSLKYDLKRCEDVVYDLTLRGLTKPRE
ncbi:hypothetical protein L486_05240 [Kwoniella mangroviensis CBS 10435]|uniref:Translin n=1 Tax=Kwoniella mangroviensis CBS 10435 TaxID=1331196 RepID=A0A1B9IQD6_9TREE|nr:uncharacterized protein I203_00031 [Kwoniella mangroviensis CBS 8507]OCF57775.1 hypothetical protein L486_05240 [Kwoniella mangroviensis CBS 10435]OCF69904.1 hypothetical protein I203_00031 [Kwoniella mangroviensis CBS 8507]OCF75679.1 hypothetical protein I204_02971 [Kwoniella mangroviensis CBS 8886]